jgi:hypothetical protein
MAVPASNRERQRNAMPELKYRRVVEMNQRLREDYDRPRCKTSDACNKYPLPLSTTPFSPAKPPTSVFFSDNTDTLFFVV